MISSLNIESTQLLIIDMQGKLAEIVVDSEEVLKNTEILIKAADLLDIPIVWVEQNPEGLGRTHEQLKALLEQKNEVFAKHTFSAYQNDEIKNRINENQRPQILVGGVESHVCVYQTVCDLLASNFEVHLVTDAVSSRKSASKALGIEKMILNGATPTSTEMLLFELLKTHQHPKFREILKLIK